MNLIESKPKYHVYLVRKGAFYPYENIGEWLSSFNGEDDALRYAKERSLNFIEKNLVVFDDDTMIAQYLNGEMVRKSDWAD